MKFPPRSAQEAAQLLQEGPGNFEVVKATEEISKKTQCPMWHFILKVWDSAGKQSLIHDYILMNEEFDWKFRYFCYAIGIGNLYETGTVNSEDIIARGGKLIIGIEVDKTGKYMPKNNVKKYIIEETKSSPSSREITAVTDELDDDIPF